MSTTISTAISAVRRQIAEAAQQFNRIPEEVQLLAVSKTRPVEDIISAIHSGQYCFGENYLQDALPKIQALQHYDNLEWHFIGALQSNKTRPVAENFNWVQSLDNFKYACRLNDQRPEHLPPLNVCIQVNLSGELQKAGINLEELQDFATEITNFPQLQLRGLMTLPAYSENFTQQRQSFHALYAAYRQLQVLGFPVDTLSMGMTDDMVAAIAEGSTMVRVGTGIFGKRA